MTNPITFTRITNDINGNPRYVCHFLTFGKDYPAAVRLANTLGGRKYSTKKYGGGIVFQSYSLDELVSNINRITGLEYSGYAL